MRMLCMTKRVPPAKRSVGLQLKMNAQRMQLWAGLGSGLGLQRLVRAGPEKAERTVGGEERGKVDGPRDDTE